MNLADRTSAALIVPRLRGLDAAGVIQELAQSMRKAELVSDILPFYHTALNRELMMTSEVEAGISFPHARLPGLNVPAFALGRSETPIAWGTNPASSVRLVFLVAVPEGDSLQYLNLACSLARLASMPSLVVRLLEASGSAGMLAVLSEVEVRDQGEVAAGCETFRETARQAGRSGRPDGP